MNSWTNLRSWSNEALGRLLVMAICLAGAGLCALGAVGSEEGGYRYLLSLGATTFLLSALLPTTFAPRFSQFLVCAVCFVLLMGTGGGVSPDVSPLDWLVILPFLLFALLLSFPGGVVALIRWMIGAGR
jgi:hypothetical protein